MIQVFCGKRGSGKTKNLIAMANECVGSTKGNIVYIDDDKRPMLELDRRIRFISTDDFSLKDYNSFYGFLCGMLSEDYDIETIFIDGLFNIVSGNVSDAAHLFLQLEALSTKFGLQIYININHESEELPEFIKKYAA
ncbi:hypothetical protein [Clostridium thermarum]|uniref:hypothetical protein n=1 Tax=Clostridium thermarum TaxID=1716543 RepID=UPI00112482C4|nr:hypothetical protein [Clostridium thermarum]